MTHAGQRDVARGPAHPANTTISSASHGRS